MNPEVVKKLSMTDAEIIEALRGEIKKQGDEISNLRKYNVELVTERGNQLYVIQDIKNKHHKEILELEAYKEKYLSMKNAIKTLKREKKNHLKRHKNW